MKWNLFIKDTLGVEISSNVSLNRCFFIWMFIYLIYMWNEVSLILSILNKLF